MTPEIAGRAVTRFNTMPASELAEVLRACCGSTQWVERMAARRPFASTAALLSACDEVCRTLSRDEWLEAFAHHPRLGESRAQVAQDERARAWSEREQSGFATAQDDVRAALAAANTLYEQQFGYICIICAAGKDPEELLAVTRARLSNTPQIELRIAADEQRKITRLRLQKLVHDLGAAEPS
jgi:OHCU decarboxylase